MFISVVSVVSERALAWAQSPGCTSSDFRPDWPVDSNLNGQQLSCPSSPAPEQEQLPCVPPSNISEQECQTIFLGSSAYFPSSTEGKAAQAALLMGSNLPSTHWPIYCQNPEHPDLQIAAPHVAPG